MIREGSKGAASAAEQGKRTELKEMLFPKGLSEYRVDLAEENGISLKILIFGGTIISALLFVLQVLFGRFPAYGHVIELMVFFGYSIAVYFAFKPGLMEHATAALYGWIVVLFGFETLLSTAFIPDQQAFTILLFLIALPLLVRDAPGKVLILIAGCAVFFMICTAAAKSPQIARQDILHTVACMLCAATLSFRILRDQIGSFKKSSRASSSAQHDGLTGIYNRRGGEMMIRNYVRSGVTGTFLLMDVDDFKHINDTYGHARGDEVLKRVAATLAANFRESDVVMRMGGDEFIVYAVGMADARNVKQKLEKLRVEMHRIVLDEEKHDFVTVSIGCAINLGSYPGYDELSQAADELLYRTKQNGKDGFSLSDKDYKGK